MSPREYQAQAQLRAAQEILHFVTTARQDAAAATPKRAVWCSPCGSGKTRMLLMAQHMICEALGLSRQQCIIVSPTYTIIKRGFLKQIGISTDDSAAWSDDRLQTICYQKYGLVTPLILKNRLSGRGKGSEGFVPPHVILLDESHHANADTYKLIDLYSGADTVWAGVTATPFRGSPKETLKFREVWGPPRVVMTLHQTVERGLTSFPTFTTTPLIDDDVITLGSNGDFVTQELEDHLTQFDRLKSLCDQVRKCWQQDGMLRQQRFDRPTMLVLPSRRCAAAVKEQLGHLADVVDGDTNEADRNTAFTRCENRETCLVTVAVVGEGVDLPWLRRIIDARPTVSPVAIMQLYGRVMRPVAAGEAPPEIVCCCRNVLRHGYLFEGLLPRQVIAKAATEFPPSDRHTGAWLGLEHISKFKKLDLPLDDGTKGWYYLLESIDGLHKTQWAIVMTPYMQKPLVASRHVSAVEVTDDTGLTQRKWQYGENTRWTEAVLPGDFTGFSTSSYRKEASTNQRRVWKQTARLRGLDPEHADSKTISGRDIEVFFAISQSKGRI